MTAPSRPTPAVTVYPFHASHPGMPDLFHVSCSEHPDFGFCGEREAADEEARAHRVAHVPAAVAPEVPHTPAVGDVITTPAELDALLSQAGQEAEPLVVREQFRVWILTEDEDGLWWAWSWREEGENGRPVHAEALALPLTVLHTGVDAPPAAPTAGVGREALARLINAEANISGTYVSYEHAERITDAVLALLAAQPTPAPVDADAVERAARVEAERRGRDEHWCGDPKVFVAGAVWGAARAGDWYRQECIDAMDRAGGGGVTVTAEQVGHFLSEFLDDLAPLHERLYVVAAEPLARRFPTLGIEVQR